MSLRCVRVCSNLGAYFDGGAVMFKNITSYLGDRRCGVCACVCVLTCTCVDGGAVMFKGECRCGVCVCVLVLTCTCVDGGTVMFKNLMS